MTKRTAGLIRTRLLLAAGALALVLSAACSKPDDKQHTAPPVPVSTVKAVAKDAPVTLHAVGTVKASDSVTIRSRVNGHIAKIHFLDGEEVAAGDLLFSIDPTSSLRLDQMGALADLSKARAQAEQAAKEMARYKSLYAQGVVSKDEYEQKATAAATAREAVHSDLATAASAGRMAGFAKISAPIGGRAGSALIDEGNLVNAAQDDLVSIKKIVPSDVEFSIPEKDLLDVKRHFVTGVLEVFAQPPGGEERREGGLLTFIDNWVDPSTGMIRLKARFPNQSQRLWPGQFVSVTMVLTNIKDAVQVPMTAVQDGPNGKFVYLVKENKAVPQAVSTGFVTDEGLMVIEKGLQKDDEVVVEGQIRLYPGARVLIPEQQAKPGEAKPGEANPQGKADKSGGAAS
ncbi:MAG: efflux RND transporter periplasmic adaptor subunit [Desulfovibrionaceae bacterium]|nr:efflux RND transporter periplasmic adaptor subunit [Desulfovibrionaceae bacterium]